MIPSAIYLIQRTPRVDGVPPTPQEVADLMIEFAKMHVKAALEEAYENVFINDYDEHEQYSPHIDKDSITKAYPETNIK